MQITSRQVYDLCMQGAYNVIENKELLNKINVFPVQDGDTGSNLASMMRSIIQKSEPKDSVKKTLESVADAALFGARGNSGIIFAQYFRGLSDTICEGDQISIEEYVEASRQAAQYAYEAVEQPVEGTIITIMREWGKILTDECNKSTAVAELFSRAFQKIEVALEKTKEQLSVLKKANVVDSGAKGFSYFIEGALHYLEKGERTFETWEETLNVDMIENRWEEAHGSGELFRYCTECLLGGDRIDLVSLRQQLRGMGNSIVVAGSQQKCRIHIHVNEPAKVLAHLRGFGTILYQKVEDMFRQEAVVRDRKYEIALVTDSIADLPQEYMDRYQIHMVNLEILYNEITFLDKLTVQVPQLLEMVGQGTLPTSSQPNPKQIENLFDYLSTYYQSIIVLTVSKELSGTYSGFLNAAKSFMNKDYKISVINTRQNAGAQGLLVKKCAEYIHEGMNHDEIVREMERKIPFSKIYVQVKTLDNMIQSGRLSVRAGAVAKRIGLKPIITLDHAGKGDLERIAFSDRGSTHRLIRLMQNLMKKHEIDQYNIVHVDNEAGAKELAEIMTNIIGFEPEYIMETSAIVAVGAGKGAIAISYLIRSEG